MSRQLEKEYIRTNDRIHPRQDLLQEMEEKWAAEEAQRAAERRKVAVFPAWARFTVAAAGILLCVGVGMGGMLLYSRSRGMGNKTASAEAPILLAEGAMDAAVLQEEEKIVYEAMEDAAVAPEAMEEPQEQVSLLTAVAEEAPQGTHFARDEAEVEDSLRFGSRVSGMAKAAGTSAPTLPPKADQGETETVYAAGKVIRRDDLMAVFQPTLEQVHVVEYVNKKLNNVFSLTMREQGTRVQQVFWLGQELLALREKGGNTELMRFDVGDWKSPRHLVDLTQSGAFLGAWELGDGLLVLSLYKATTEEPLPWVNEARLDFDRVLLDADRPGDRFAVLTLYEPGRADGFAAEIALLSPVRGAVATGDERLLLWTDTEDLYAFARTEEGLTLLAESTLSGTVLSACGAGEGFSLLLRDGEEAVFVSLDAQLAETGRTAARTGPVRWAQVYEDGAVVLTADAIHYLTGAGDRSMDLTGDAFYRLTPERGLVLSADGHVQVLSLGADLKVLSDIHIRGGLGSLLDDLDRLAFDPDSGRLVIPAGQFVYPYYVNEVGNIYQRGEVQVFYDHDETDQRELRSLLVEDKTLVFYKFGVFLCNHNLIHQMTCKY